MCNITGLMCDCGTVLETHIGDFSVEPEKIKAFCPKCKQKALKYILKFDKQLIVFASEGCLFMVELPRSIALNGGKECIQYKNSVRNKRSKK